MIKKVSIIIPVFNEEKTVDELLNRVIQQPLPFGLQRELVIVESNSKDHSREIVQKFVANNKNSEVQLILQEVPRGKGSAVREGLEKVTGDIVIIQDADLEYEVTDYPQLLTPIYNGQVDFVLGSRHLSAGSWKIRKFAEHSFKAVIMNIGGVFFHTLFNLVYGVKLTDPTTMYKVFRTKCISGVVFEGQRFDFDFELVAKLIRLGFIPLEVPISYKSRDFAEGKKVKMILDPLLYIKCIFKHRFNRIHRRTELTHG